MDLRSPWEELKAQCILGSKAFLEKIAPIVKDKSTITEIPREQRYANRAALEELFPNREFKSKEERNSAIRMAYFENGYSMAEIARHVGLHYTTISKTTNANTCRFQHRNPIVSLSLSEMAGVRPGSQRPPFPNLFASVCLTSTCALLE
jgi:hypothetical protein